MAAFTSITLLAEGRTHNDNQDKLPGFRVPGYRDVGKIHKSVEAVAPANQDSEDSTSPVLIYTLQDPIIVLGASIGYWSNWPYDEQPVPAYSFGINASNHGTIIRTMKSGSAIIGAGAATVRYETSDWKEVFGMMIPMARDDNLVLTLSTHNDHATQGETLHVWAAVFCLIKD